MHLIFLCNLTDYLLIVLYTVVSFNKDLKNKLINHHKNFELLITNINVEDTDPSCGTLVDGIRKMETAHHVFLT